MAWTISELLDDARGHLNDRVEPLRYSDEDLIVYFNNALQEIRRLRPDAFVASWGTDLPKYTIADVGEDVPVDEQFYTAMAYFISGNAELRDDEFVIDGRVAGLLKQFVGKLVTSGA